MHLNVLVRLMPVLSVSDLDTQIMRLEFNLLWHVFRFKLDNACAYPPLHWSMTLEHDTGANIQESQSQKKAD